MKIWTNVLYRQHLADDDLSSGQRAWGVGDASGTAPRPTQRIALLILSNDYGNIELYKLTDGPDSCACSGSLNYVML